MLYKYFQSKKKLFTVKCKARQIRIKHAIFIRIIIYIEH